jgi:hypothetical protein
MADIERMSCRWPTPTGNPPQLPQGHGWWPVVAPTLTPAAAARFTSWIEIDYIDKCNIKRGEGGVLRCDHRAATPPQDISYIAMGGGGSPTRSVDASIAQSG